MKPTAFGRAMLLVILAGVIPSVFTVESFAEQTYSIKFTVTSALPFKNTPLDPVIDFGSLAHDAGGMFNPNSVQLVNSKTAEVVPHALSSDFTY